MCCSYHTASKYTFHVYTYIRGLDLLFKGPAFNYNSTTRRKLYDSVKGLVALCTILNDDVKEHFRLSYDAFKEKYRSVDAKAMRKSKAAYKQEVLIEKPRLSSTHSPSPTPVETCDDDFAMNAVQWYEGLQRKKAKVSLD